MEKRYADAIGAKRSSEDSKSRSDGNENDAFVLLDCSTFAQYVFTRFVPLLLASAVLFEVGHVRSTD